MSGALIADNLNLLWCSLIVAELVKNGLDTFIISPGSRNAPLIAALAHEARAFKKTCIDERAAAYRALGHAKATGRAGVLVCTSGTAAANYYPAVIEASRENIPLVILSADRPPELVGSDADQTILQQGLYGPYCRESLALPPPSVDYPLAALLAKVDHLVAQLTGPVHMNCPFRDPLVPGQPDRHPIPEGLLAEARRLYGRVGPYTAYHGQIDAPAGLDAVTAILARTGRGIAVVGRLDSPEDAPALAGFLKRLGWPVFCDVASSMKGLIPPDTQIFSLDHPEAVRAVGEYAPEAILQFGSGLVSKQYYAAILWRSAATVIQVSPRDGLRDPAHRVTVRIRAPIHAVAHGLDIPEGTPFDSAARAYFLGRMDTIYRAVQKCVPEDILNFSSIALALSAGVADGEGLFLGNSLVIRAFDAVRFPFPRRVRVITNRGVSGIEGHIATSVGFAEASRQRVTSVIGDISFLHDLNSLLLLSRSATPVVLVVINNGGGRIFDRLPIASFPEVLDPYMTTPHTMNFRALADQFGLPYFLAGNPAELTVRYAQARQEAGSAMLEVTLSPGDDLRTFLAMQQVRLEG